MRPTWIALATVAIVCGKVETGRGDPPPKAPSTSPAKAIAGPGEKDRADTPLSHEDAGSGIVIYVETDRHHVAALDQSGRILWHRDLLKEEAEHIKNAKRIEPAISGIGIPAAWELKLAEVKSKPGPFAGIIFSNVSSGIIDMSTGELFGLCSN
jgi:hypothetical protein